MEEVHDQEQNAKFQALKIAIREGLSSGLSDRTVPQIMEEGEIKIFDPALRPENRQFQS